MDEARERFLKSIVERIPLERIVELHIFRSIRSSQAETGVAVIAVSPPQPPVAEFPPDASRQTPDGSSDTSRQSPVTSPNRLEVHTAHYRWIRKGPERGRWIFAVDPQADAPLATVESVVRGVQERAGDALDPVRYTAPEIQEFLAAPPWQAAR